MNSILEPSVYRKLQLLESSIEQSFKQPLTPPNSPGRDLQVVMADELPPKKGLSYVEGQARLLHDLANIELQAMELCLRTLNEFPQAPTAFREQLAMIAKSEGTHLKLCLDAIERLNFRWGHWPVHTALWHSTSSNDSLIDRILIVHRYLEGSGLDAGDTLLRRLAGVADGIIHPVVKTIFSEELDHVNFGSHWYREICKQEKIDSASDFGERIEKIRYKVPKRIEKISREARRKAGFTDQEIEVLENLRNSMVKYPSQKLLGNSVHIQ